MKYFIHFMIATLSYLSLNPSHANTISLRDKIGQMLIIGFDGKQIDSQSPVVKAIEKHNIGGVILFDYNFQTKQFDKNIESPAQVKSLNDSLQQFNEMANITHNRPQLPLLISVDYEGGKVNRLKSEYGFPNTLSAENFTKLSTPKADSVASQMAWTLKEAGFNLDFAPVVDVNVNPDNPVIGKLERSFSSDPLTVANYAQIQSSNFTWRNIQCAYKHLPY